MTTEELTEAQQELADAQAERAELDGLIRGLEDQVRAGEATEAEQRLAEEYSVRRLAQLRAEAAEKRVRDAEAAALEERRQAAVQAARGELEALSPEVLADACEEALRAVEKVQRLGDARREAIRRHAQAFLDLGMRDRIRHQDGGWIVFELGGVKYDTQQDHLAGRALLAAVEGERHRRTLIPGYLAKGFNPPESDPHPMARLLAARTDAGGAEL